MIVLSPTDSPKVGLFSLNEGSTVPPAALARIARLAEELGYESLWMGEHPVLPDPPVGSPFSAQLELVDPVISLSYVAAVTSRIKLATGILLLPLRNPLILAKAAASLDHLSQGRLMLGFGMGYIPHQAAAFGVDFRERSAVGLEHLEALRSLLHDVHPEYHGKYVDFSRVDAYPRPVQSSIPLIAGGHSPLALRRAVTHSHGWYGFGLTPEGSAATIRQIEEIARTSRRPDDLGPLEITVTPPRGPLRPGDLERYAAAGVHRVVVFPPLGTDLEGLADFVVRHAPVTVPST